MLLKTGNQPACRTACLSLCATTAMELINPIRSLQQRQLNFFRNTVTRTCFLLLVLYGRIIRMLRHKIFLITIPGRQCLFHKLLKMISVIYPKQALQRFAMTTIQLGSTQTINAECGRATTQPLSSWIDRSGGFLTNWNKLAFETRRQSSSAAIMAIISASMGFGRNTITMKTSLVFPLSFQPRVFHLGGLVHLLN